MNGRRVNVFSEKSIFFRLSDKPSESSKPIRAHLSTKARAHQSLKKIFLFLRSTLTRLGGPSPTNRALKNMHHKTVLKCNGCARFENYFITTNGPDL